MIEYIHYGSDKFNKEKFEAIKNRPELVKPTGGLWGSRIDSTRSWKRWCEENEFELQRLTQSFKFRLKPEAKVLIIDSQSKLKGLPEVKNILGRSAWKLLNFEELAKEYDAIEVLLSSDGKLYWDLYGWDCDSIIVMNPEAIEIIKE